MWVALNNAPGKMWFYASSLPTHYSRFPSHALKKTQYNKQSEANTASTYSVRELAKCLGSFDFGRDNHEPLAEPITWIRDDGYRMSLQSSIFQTVYSYQLNKPYKPNQLKDHPSSFTSHLPNLLTSHPLFNLLLLPPIPQQTQ